MHKLLLVISIWQQTRKPQQPHILLRFNFLTRVLKLCQKAGRRNVVVFSEELISQNFLAQDQMINKTSFKKRCRTWRKEAATKSALGCKLECSVAGEGKKCRSHLVPPSSSLEASRKKRDICFRSIFNGLLKWFSTLGTKQTSFNKA